ncbi:unnamed protein product [Moneuplotes crassus]|uniref:Uncharacterized protein n=1 Tax=Euplotes crassus TaxID=5936 RepID=A0AAD1XK27_EUPCR|nr:unnamed protein product [Moneuplotes crassus]
MSRSRSQGNFGMLSFQSMSRNHFVHSPRVTSSYSTSQSSFNKIPTFTNTALRVSKIPLHEMFKKHIGINKGSILPENMYHPPKSQASLLKSPSYRFPKTKNKSFIHLMEKHGKAVPGPSDYEKPMKWINNTARDLGKGVKRVTVIDQIYKEKKKIPSPSDYETLRKYKSKITAFDKANGFNFLSETEHLAQRNPSPDQYKPEEKWVTKKVPQYKIVKSKENKMNWKPVKTTGASVGLYSTTSHLVLPKSPRTVFAKEKLKSVIQGMSLKKKKVPGVGEYTINPCYDKISRPMRTSRV